MAALFQRIIMIIGFMCACTSLQTHASTPLVVVTLKPIHSLVASVMAGVAEPTLLLPDGASPHTFMLKPSTLKAFQDADLVVWVGPSLETFMVKPLATLKPKEGFIEIATLDKLIKLPLREGREWEQGDPEHSHDHDHSAHGTFDPHVWLSTTNAQTIVNVTAERLAKADPQHAKQYFANAKKTNKELQVLKNTLRNLLVSVQNEPFLVYHDGYQYFENEFDLKAVGTMVINPHLPLSAHGLTKIKALIKERGVKCVFKETEFNERMIENSLGTLPIKIKELDPLGVHISKGPQHYQQTLLEIGKTLEECLQSKVQKGAHK